MMPAKKQQPTEESRPQDDPNYRDAGQAGAAEVNEEQAKREADAASERD